MEILSFEVLPSTNTYACEHFDTLKDGQIVLAKTQTAGRGRKERVWLSYDGGLYFSLVVKLQNFKIDFLGSLTQAMALSVCKTLQGIGAKAVLKWPNDILCEGKKICGILSQAVFKGNKLSGVVIGVGVNIAQEKIDSPKPAISLKMLGIKAKKEDVLKNIYQRFEKYYPLVCANGFSAIREEFLNNFPFINKEIKIVKDTQEILGICHGLDDRGQLLIDNRVVNIGDME